MSCEKTSMDRADWFDIVEPLSAELLRRKASETSLHKVEIKPPKSYEAVLTLEMAREFARFSGLCELVLWCKVERAAINEIISLSGLESLVIIFGMPPGGELKGFERAVALREFACDYDMGEADLLQVTKAPVLKILRAQGSRPTSEAMEAILQMPRIVSLDLESSSFDDEMAQHLATSEQITELEVGASKITAQGLAHIAGMKQLQKLDVWATDLHMEDLDDLQKLNQLEYLSVGSAFTPPKFSGERLIEKLHAIPALKRLWLDGVVLTSEQLEELRQRYEYVMASAPED